MIIPAEKRHAKKIAKIHKEALAGDFLPSLGLGFLTAFYEGIIGQPNVLTFVFEEKDKIKGFVLGTTDSGRFFKEAIKNNLLKLIFCMTSALLKKPYLIKNIVETVFYPSKEKGPKAELVVISVGSRWQGQGIGKELTLRLEKTLEKSGIKEYKVTVHADKTAVTFYEHLKYIRISSFSLYGKLWYLYTKKL